jgi:hypothetical protein
LTVLAILLILALVGACTAFSKYPAVGAQGADVLRSMIGDEAVANLEMTLFQVQDIVQKFKFQVGLASPEVPWQAATAEAAGTAAGQAAEVVASPSGGDTQSDMRTPASTPSPNVTRQPQETSPAFPDASLTPRLTLTPVVWPPAALGPLGNLQGEGIWQPYIQDGGGRKVAYRTFLQPDSSRPFAVVGVVAFDLACTRLHYVLGFEEPYSPGMSKRSGAMPVEDKAPGMLLAAFNGGFKATHGHFGAMSCGVAALPPKDGLGTLAIYTDGRVKMGLWGSTILPSEDMQAWRQNGPLVVQDGQINPEIYNNDPKDWGYTVKDVSPTWRSGIGISADGQTLYYFAGPSLSIEALAKGMLAAGAVQGMQLDINNYWVHFVAVHFDGEELTLDPLFPAAMNQNIDRYLYPHGRDFFYVTAGG